MGKILVEGMEFYAYHGCFKEEQIVGNHFKVDLEMEADCTIAAQTDNISDAVNYQKAYEIINKEMAIKSHLLENVCDRILNSLFFEFKSLEKATVKVSKMNPPMGGKILCTSVVMTKSKNE